MRSDLTDITLVVDRSGSMQSIQSDAEGGINHFIERQQQEPGAAMLTLVQFDTDYEFVHQGVPIQQVPSYRLLPRGATALLDAVGRGISETGSRLAAIPESERPGLVIFVIVTDGLENSSREFSRDQIRQMIDHQQSTYNWQFTFLAANQDAFAEGGTLGIAAAGIAGFAVDKMRHTYGVVSAKVSRMRKARSAGEAVSNEFTEAEREQLL